MNRKNPHAHKNKIGTSTPPSKKKTQNPPPSKGGILWAWGFSSRKNQKMPGAHKIGAAISGPRITGGNFMDTTFFLNENDCRQLWTVDDKYHKPPFERPQKDFWEFCESVRTNRFARIAPICAANRWAS